MAFEYNTEINVEITRDSIDHPELKMFHDWMLNLVERSEPLRRRDILAPFQVGGSVINWSNKARYLPKRNLALRALPFLLVFLFFSGAFSWLLRFL